MNVLKICVCTLAIAAVGCTPPKGEIGPKGPQGVAGINGTNGTNGLVGDKGVVGDKGAVGAVGLSGAKGPTGDLLTFYSGWKPLTFKLESEQTTAGVLTAQYSAEFAESTLSQAIIDKGSVMIFMDRKGISGTPQVNILKSSVQSSYTFIGSTTERYGIRGILNEAGKVKFTINVESSTANAQGVLDKIKNENIHIQTYAIAATN